MRDGFVSRKDSIGRFNDNSHMINARKSPHDEQMRKRMMESGQSSRKRLDELETDRKKLERQLLERWTRLNFDLKHERVNKAWRIGRVAFLAVTLPPYILCVGAPRWIVKKGIPLVLRKMFRVLKPVTDLLLGMKNLTAKMLEQLNALFQKQLNLLRQITKMCKSLLNKAVDNTFGKAYKGIVSAVQNLAEKILHALQAPNRALSKTAEMFRDLSKNVKQFLKALPKQLLNYMADRLKNAAKRVIINIKRPFLPVLKAVGTTASVMKHTYQATKQVVSDVKTGLQTVVVKTAKLVAETGRKATEYTKIAVNKVVEQVKHVTEPLKEWIAPKVEAVHEFKEFVKERVDNMKTKVKETVETTKKYVREKVSNLGNVAMKAIQNLGAMIPLPVMQFFSKETGVMKATRNVASVIKGMKRRLKSLKEKLEYLAGIFKNASKGVASGAHIVFRNFGSFPAWIMRFLLAFLRVLKLFLKDVIVGINVMIAVIHLTFVQTRIILRSKTNDFGEWLRHQQVGRG